MLIETPQQLLMYVATSTISYSLFSLRPSRILSGNPSLDFGPLTEGILGVESVKGSQQPVFFSH